MEKGYISTLTKPVLAYNLCYHLKEAKTDEEIQKVVAKILDAFEYTSDVVEV